MSINSRIKIAALFGALLAVGAQAQTTFTYNFNAGEPDFQSTFSRNGASGSGSFYYYSSGGISDSGRIQPDGSFRDSAVYNTGLVNSGTITISAMFKTSPNTYNSSSFGDVFALGLYLTPNTETNSAGNMVAVLIDGSASGLISDSWYLATTTFTHNGSTYAATATIQPYDAFGNSTGSAFTVNSGNYGGAALLAASTVYAGIYGGTAGGNAVGARAIDSFSVSGTSAIPEPSTYAAFMGAAALGGVMLWRRREPEVA